MKTWNEWSVVKRLYGVFAMVGLVISGQMVLSYTAQLRSQQTLESVRFRSASTVPTSGEVMGEIAASRWLASRYR